MAKRLDVDENYFKVDDNLIEARESSTYTYGVSEEELPFLPTNSEVESVLKESSTYVINDETYYILTYEGSKPFTLVQRLLKDNESVIKNMVELLLQKETIFAEEVDMLISGMTAKE